MISFTGAKDETYSRFWSLINANSSILGYVPVVRWFGTNLPATPESNKTYAEVRFEEVTSGQSSLSACVDQPGKSKYTSEGLFTAVFHSALNLPGELAKAEELAQKVREGFGGWHSPGGVWYRQTRIASGIAENFFYKTLLLIEFEFDEVR